MPDDQSIRTLLEKLCSLQEQQLAKLSELLDRTAAARQRVEELSQRWITAYEDSQKKLRARAAGQSVGLWIRGILTLIMLALIIVAIIVQRYLK
jgi:hypothetical protein